MDDEKYNSEFAYFRNIFDGFLSETNDNLYSCAETIVNAMRYAVENGGKRVRPILCIATNAALGGTPDNVKEYAVAIEYIHSYSLVHDDLPAMDNDDYRRGKLSTHKKFGEGIGILAGDALLNGAFEIMLNRKNINQSDVVAMKIIAEYAGYSGMIAGQTLDLENEKTATCDEKLLYNVYENKTSKLLTAPLLVASVKNGRKYYEELKQFGFELGTLFQITDDILDEESELSVLGKTPHKDKESGKLTSVAFFGLDGAKKKARERYENCLDAVSKCENFDFIRSFAKKIYERKS